MSGIPGKEGLLATVLPESGISTYPFYMRYYK